MSKDEKINLAIKIVELLVGITGIVVTILALAL
jgi:hypothetical protein